MSLDALGNIGYVRRLWDAYEAGGVAAMIDLVPPDVIWRPLAANGRTLQGTEELVEFWTSQEIEVPSLRMFHGRGDDVLVEAEYRHRDESARTVWFLYRFKSDRLVEALAFASEREARDYSPLPSRADRDRQPSAQPQG